MKSYTTTEQSRKLAEILPLESADMWYQYTGISIKDGSEKPVYFPMVIRDCESDEDIPCWSLAALLDILPTGKALIHDKESCKYKCICKDIDTNFYDNLVDVCYEMILKSNELNLL